MVIFLVDLPIEDGDFPSPSRFLGLFTFFFGHPQGLGPWYVLAGPGNGNHALGDRSQFQRFRWGRGGRVAPWAAPGAMGNPTLRCALRWETGDVVGFWSAMITRACKETMKVIYRIYRRFFKSGLFRIKAFDSYHRFSHRSSTWLMTCRQPNCCVVGGNRWFFGCFGEPSYCYKSSPAPAKPSGNMVLKHC